MNCTRNYENLLNFVKVMPKILVFPFLRTRCSYCINGHRVPALTVGSYTDEQGWVEYSRGSLNGSKYIVIDKSMTFYGAQDQCRKYGGYLAHVNTIREQVFLENFLIHELQLYGKYRSCYFYLTVVVERMYSETVLSDVFYTR